MQLQKRTCKGLSGQLIVCTPLRRFAQACHFQHIVALCILLCAVLFLREASALIANLGATTREVDVHHWAIIRACVK
jgi:hypothetical protein